MLIPDFQTIMLPLLERLKGGEEQIMEKVEDHLAGYFELTEEALDKQVQNVGQTVFRTSILEATAHLKKAGLLVQTQAGLKITNLGKQVVNRRLNSIDTQYLRRLPGYLD